MQRMEKSKLSKVNRISICGKTRETQNNMENGNTESDKWEEFGGGAMEQQTRIRAIRDRTTLQDVLNQNYIYRI